MIMIIKKIALSLFCSCFIFFLFYYFLFSNLFESVETKFYIPHVKSYYQSQLDEANISIAEVQSHHSEIFSDVADDDILPQLFSFNLPAEIIREVTNLFGSLSEEVTAFSYARIYDAAGDRIWYSTLERDIESQTSNRRQYVPIQSFNDEYYSPQRILRLEDDQHILYDPSDQNILYRYPILVPPDFVVGVIVFYTSLQDINARLLRDNLINLGENVAMIDDSSLLLNSSTAFDVNIKDNLFEHSVLFSDNEDLIPISNQDTAKEFIVFSQQQSPTSRSLLLVPSNELFFGEDASILALILIFSILFVLLFLFFNLWQPPRVIIESRLQKLRRRILKEYRNMSIDDRKDWYLRFEEDYEKISNRMISSFSNNKRILASDIKGIVLRGFHEIVVSLGDVVSDSDNYALRPFKRISQVDKYAPMGADSLKASPESAAGNFVNSSVNDQLLDDNELEGAENLNILSGGEAIEHASRQTGGDTSSNVPLTESQSAELQQVDDAELQQVDDAELQQVDDAELQQVEMLSCSK